MIRIGVVGYGYWGPNIVRNIARHPSLSLAWICDINTHAVNEVTRIYPTVKTTSYSKDVFADPSVDAVIIVTPPSTHYQLAKAALESGKHVLVEKPMTTELKSAAALVKLAGKHNKILMVDHTFLYTPALKLLKTVIDSGDVGDIYAVDSVRTNLGIVQKDSNVMQDLAVHDFSIMDYLFQMTPGSISATGISDSRIHQETVAYISAQYGGNMFFHSHISWLSPVKIRRMIFTGTKKMLVYDDMEPSEKIKIYDKGVSVVSDPQQSRQMKIGYRNGEIVIPNIPMEEGLWGVINAFESSIRTSTPPASDGSQGARIVSYLDAATRSMRSSGKSITIEP